MLDHYGFRIDLHYSSGNGAQSDYPVIGPYGTKKGPFLEVISKWLDICPEIHRLAFGAVLIIPVDNRIQGYQILQGYLPKLSLDVENSSDLIYQINRPRIIEGFFDNIAINRLSRWTVESMQFGRIEFNPIKIEMPIVKSAGNYSCKLRLDINTPIGLDELPRKSLKELFRTLVSLAEEIASYGDMP